MKIACGVAGFIVLFLGAFGGEASPAPPIGFTATGMSPAPGSSVTAAPSSIVLTFSNAVDSHTVLGNTIRLFRPGPDGAFGTADDVAVAPASVSLAASNQVKLDLTGVALPNDLYQVRLSGTESAVSTADLVGHWRLDEGSGPSAFDSSGNGNTGTLEGPTWTTGILGGALSFDGVENRVSVDVGDLATPWTASMWVKRTDSPSADARLMDSAAYPAGTSLRLEQYGSGNKVGITKYGSADYAFPYVAPAGSWVHLAFVGTSTDTSLYANGNLAGTLGVSLPLSVAKFGSHGANTMKGVLDDVRVYNRKLTAGEIQVLATLGGTLRDTSGTILDGEFAGAFPSGDGVPGGDFAAAFTLSVPPPPPPTNLTASTLSPSEISLAWSDNSTGETGFRIERSTDGVAFAEVAVVPQNVTAFAEGDLAGSTQYFYRVRAYGPSGNSTYSNLASAVTLASPPSISVVQVTPAPGSVLNVLPKEILLTLNGELNSDTVTPFTARLVRAGGDGVLGTADDVRVAPKSVGLLGSSQIRIDLTDVVLPDGPYRVVLSGTQTVVSGAAGHWKFDEGSGSNALDSSGSNTHGTLSGPTWTTGKIGKALRFNGSTDRVTIGGANIAPPWTAAMWVRRKDSLNADSRLMDCEAYGTGGSLRLEQFNQTNKVGFTKYGSADYAFGYTAPVDSWVHLTFLCGAAGTSLYVNGILVDTVGASIDLPRYYLGSQGANSLVGDFDEVRIYAKALTEKEIQSLATFGGAIRSVAGGWLDGDSVADFSIQVPTGTLGSTESQGGAGGCGFLGAEILLVLAALALWKRGAAKQ